MAGEYSSMVEGNGIYWLFGQLNRYKNLFSNFVC